jgi:hypothetical protein
MSDYRPYIRLPLQMFSGHLSVLVSEPHDDEQFAAHQVEFVRHVFGRCAYLREHSRAMPVSDTFLSVFVNLIDVLEANAPAQAGYFATQLYQVLRVSFPDIEPPPGLHITRSPDGVSAKNVTPKPNGKTNGPDFGAGKGQGPTLQGNCMKNCLHTVGYEWGL